MHLGQLDQYSQMDSCQPLCHLLGGAWLPTIFFFVATTSGYLSMWSFGPSKVADFKLQMLGHYLHLQCSAEMRIRNNMRIAPKRGQISGCHYTPSTKHCVRHLLSKVSHAKSIQYSQSIYIFLTNSLCIRTWLSAMPTRYCYYNQSVLEIWWNCSKAGRPIAKRVNRSLERRAARPIKKADTIRR